MLKQTVDKSDPIPRYLQVRRILEEAIRTGKYQPGARLPGERDLALQLNVSQMTVNKALAAMESEGWLRREIGRGTFIGASPPIAPLSMLRAGFAVPANAAPIQDDFYLSALLRGIRQAIINTSVSLTILEIPTDSLFERLARAPLDGCLLTDVLDTNLADLQRLAQEGRRMVVLSADRDPIHVPFVDSDNYGGACAAMEHLIALGHRRIAGVFAFINSCDSRHRQRAYHDILRSHAIAVPKAFEIAFGDVYPLLEPLHERTRALLAHEPRPTAFFCGGYYIALEVMKAIREAGLEIPADISIVGFDDPVSARYLSPPLTTVRQPLEEMGELAMRKLLTWLYTHEEPAALDVLPAALVVRQSTAPVAATG